MDSTVYRHLDTVALVVGGSAALGDRCAAAFEQAAIRVVRVAHAAAACERLPIAMPQIVVVLGALEARDRADLLDRATAVGAIMFDLDESLDADTLDTLLDRAANAAIERGLVRDEPVTRPDREHE
jgi:NADP-dependent 3-hydroxy acid dehydrogenase YdfG